MKGHEAQMSMIDDLQAIYESWSEKEAINGHRPEAGYMLRSFSHEDLPPIKDASKDNHKLIAYTENDEIVGFTDIYIGYPDRSCVWIGLMVIDKKYRRMGYGRKIIRHLENTYSKDLGIGVDVKNLSGLKFWFMMGFDKLLSVNIDPPYGVLGLRKCVI